MRRRQYLASVTVLCSSGIAGCAVRAPGTPPTDATRRITIEAQDAVPDELEISISAEMRAEYVTPDTPAQLTVTITNHGPPRLLPSNECHLFRCGDGRSSPPGLWLREPGLDEQDGDGWTLEPRPVGCPAFACLGSEYDPGESRTIEYLVWNTESVPQAGYFQPGTYRFETSIRLPDERTVYWGVELRVDEIRAMVRGY